MDKIAALWATAVVVGVILAFLALGVGLVYHTEIIVLALVSIIPLIFLALIWREVYYEVRRQRLYK